MSAKPISPRHVDLDEERALSRREPRYRLFLTTGEIAVLASTLAYRAQELEQLKTRLSSEGVLSPDAAAVLDSVLTDLRSMQVKVRKRLPWLAGGQP